jgi:predicted metal-dependent TIM-barrel fold hydrolase
VTEPTEEMLQAGAQAVIDRLATFRPVGWSADELAAEVWAAMRELEPARCGKATMKLKLDTSDLERTVAQFAETVAEFKAAVAAAIVEE